MVAAAAGSDICQNNRGAIKYSLRRIFLHTKKAAAANAVNLKEDLVESEGFSIRFIHPPTKIWKIEDCSLSQMH